MITCQVCDKAVQGAACECGWAPDFKRQGIAYRSTEHPAPKGISRSEFGEQLYLTLGLIGGIMQLRRYRGLVAMGQMEKTDDFQKREAKLKEQLATVMVHIPANDVAAIVQKYPWVAAC